MRRLASRLAALRAYSRAPCCTDGPHATTTRPRRGDDLELTVDTLAYGGAGVARLDGYVVFVQGGIPGDTVRVEVGKAKRAYAEARVFEVVTPSPDRIAPLAHHPGAPWQVIPYAKQLEIKHEQVDDALRRIGKLDGYVLEPIIPPSRSGATATSSSTRSARTPTGRLICGFHAPGRWEDIVEVTDCMLASEKGNRAREEVAAWCRAQGLEPYDRRTGEGFLRNLVVREGRRTGEIQVRLVTTRGQARRGRRLAAAVPTADGLLWTRLDSVAETTDRRRDRTAGGRRAARGAARRALGQHLGRGLLPDQHRDG